MRRPSVQPIPFSRLVTELAQACERAGFTRDYDVQIDDALTEEHRMNPRRYAAVSVSGRTVFYFAEQVLSLPFSHRMGLYAHEIGHVLDPDPNKTEDGADRHGMIALDLLILYDHRWPGKGLQVAVW